MLKQDENKILKKALELACEELEKAEIKTEIMCESCVDCGRCGYCGGPKPTSSAIWKQYFIQQAGIEVNNE